ncbi:divalent-cation tolerance protein CutA [Neiella marina]|uniref:Divalent-cation tolerance protein CutA n=1 Tax=Neiella holothuriorum TaxID=2870530 RepID=A0ABS7ELL1_9GAMM|nr:divalent-cation tolerance protein CutA [Neiella holothuriorum]MBW8192506.1 divalent-cation tolerance protein CutA [Neiella holothuriorum]
MTSNSQANSQLKILLTTCADQQQAATLANGLLAQRLAACINVLPQMQSWYRWQQKVCHDPEVQLVIKTSSEKVIDAMAWLEQHHPYDTPELVVLTADDASQTYRQWVINECS